jgi:hypothetical protein
VDRRSVRAPERHTTLKFFDVDADDVKASRLQGRLTRFSHQCLLATVRRRMSSWQEIPLRRSVGLNARSTAGSPTLAAPPEPG